MQPNQDCDHGFLCRWRRAAGREQCLLTLPAAALLHFPRRPAEPFNLSRSPPTEIQFHFPHQLFISPQMVRRDGSVRALAEITIVLRRDVGCDQLALAGVRVFGRAASTSASAFSGFAVSG